MKNSCYFFPTHPDKGNMINVSIFFSNKYSVIDWVNERLRGCALFSISDMCYIKSIQTHAHAHNSDRANKHCARKKSARLVFNFFGFSLCARSHRVIETGVENFISLFGISRYDKTWLLSKFWFDFFRYGMVWFGSVWIESVCSLAGWLIGAHSCCTFSAKPFAISAADSCLNLIMFSSHERIKF